jgi:hypothetical protein
MVRRLLHVFDLDDTLFHFPRGHPNYDDPEDLRDRTYPILRHCRHVRDLIQAKHHVMFLTGRSEPARKVTLRQLRQWVHPRITSSWIVMQDQWRGYDYLATFKARNLRTMQRVVQAHGLADLQFIGDHEKDQEAAAMALVEYHHPDSYFAQAVPA